MSKSVLLRILSLSLAGLMTLSAPGAAAARTVVLPAGTLVRGELDEQVTSRKKDATVGDTVNAHVWRDVIVDGHVALAAGSPMVVRVATVRRAKLAGIKGNLKLEAVSAESVDGETIPLEGGYGRGGVGRKALSISLAAVVAWPLIFIRGKQAILQQGTVFNAEVQADTKVAVADEKPRHVRLAPASTLEARILEDELHGDAAVHLLPVEMTSCAGPIEKPFVVTVNGIAIEKEPVVVLSSREEKGCRILRGTVNLDHLGKHFRRGINRFEIGDGDSRAEIILDAEL